MAAVQHRIDPMHAQSEFLSSLQLQSQHAFQRSGVVLQGEADWQESILSAFLQTQTTQRWFCVGDWSFESAFCVGMKQGNRLLGRECDVLLFDARKEFDANSFTAAIGSLVGGGMLLVVTNTAQPQHFAEQWMQTQWQKLIVLEQGKVIPQVSEFAIAQRNTEYIEQTHAVSLIEKVVNGHRKRPLVLTADRGRGKSSALGIACAQLLQHKPLRILLTAPSINAVEPVYQHAQRLLTDAKQMKKDRLEVGYGYIQFIAPDELLSSLPECDLLLVDEAAAIPVPMLKQITEHYHRLVFSSTIHGYEGCGRGFTLKFIEWLQQQRPGMKTYHMQQPIRWSVDDKLETWLYDAFILNAELSLQSIEGMANVSLNKVDKQALVLQPNLLRECFALLVNAHYQTSPNDLLHLLRDDNSSVYLAMDKQNIIGVILTVEEGGLDDELIEAVQLGQRRPKGHLTPITIINQLGLVKVGRLITSRVMRIAVHPDLQGSGIGKRMLTLLEESVGAHVDYLSTSFGATDELIQFWQQAGYQSIRLGTMRDAASGCYSLLMVRQLANKSQTWIDDAQALFHEFLSASLSLVYPKLEPSLARSLLRQPIQHQTLHPTKRVLLQSYAQGGASYESIFVWLQQWLRQYGLAPVSDLMISKVFLNHDWGICAKQFGLSGRKQVEQQLRSELEKLLNQFTV
ncbi:DEAD/DEAH box helicase [Vibrio parahaemolyticus]|nr:DEAD/DEAH box helicase [Vibrio parahaemolyticus]